VYVYVGKMKWGTMMDVKSLSKRLEALSWFILKVVVFEQAVSGLRSIRVNATFLSKIAGFDELAASFFLSLIYTSELVFVVTLCIPVVRDRPSNVAMTCASLSLALAVETGIAVSSDDDCNRTKALFLTATCIKHAVSAACSRRLCVYGGSMGADSLTDTVSSFMRERASRYKLASGSCIAIAIILVYTFINSQNPLSSAPLSRMMGRCQYARGFAVVSLLSAVGSEDHSHREFGRNKNI